jgi:hypothetical protein
MCYAITKFAKRILRAIGRPIRIEREIRNTGIFICRKPCKEEKVPRQN